MRSMDRRGLQSVLAGAMLLCATALGNPAVVMTDFTSDRFGGLPPDTLQLVVFYDGDYGPAFGLPLTKFTVEFWDPATGNCAEIEFEPYPIHVEVLTVEVFLDGFVPTGRVTIANVHPNGALDGIAYGMFWTDTAGKRFLAKSRNMSGSAAGIPDFVGGWPYAYSQAEFDSMFDTIGWGTGYAGYDLFVVLRHAQMIISGAEVLGNGTWGTPGVPTLPGDLNGDGCIDLMDLTIMLSSFGQCLCP